VTQAPVAGSMPAWAPPSFPGPMPAFRGIITTWVRRTRAPAKRYPVGLGSSPYPARCRRPTDQTCEEPSSNTVAPLAGGLASGDSD
jgi:hypothetical protein